MIVGALVGAIEGGREETMVGGFGGATEGALLATAGMSVGARVGGARDGAGVGRAAIEAGREGARERAAGLTLPGMADGGAWTGSGAPEAAVAAGGAEGAVGAERVGAVAAGWVDGRCTVVVTLISCGSAGATSTIGPSPGGSPSTTTSAVTAPVPATVPLDLFFFFPPLAPDTPVGATAASATPCSSPALVSGGTATAAVPVWGKGTGSTISSTTVFSRTVPSPATDRS